jgi:hypothetical protein
MPRLASMAATAERLREGAGAAPPAAPGAAGEAAGSGGSAALTAIGRFSCATRDVSAGAGNARARAARRTSGEATASSSSSCGGCVCGSCVCGSCVCGCCVCGCVCCCCGGGGGGGDGCAARAGGDCGPSRPTRSTALSPAANLPVSERGVAVTAAAGLRLRVSRCCARGEHWRGHMPCRDCSFYGVAEQRHHLGFHVAA